MLCKTSRKKGNQTIKFGHLIEYNMKNIFLEKSYTRCDREIIPWPFSKKIKIKRIFGSKISCSLFSFCVKLKAIKLC